MGRTCSVYGCLSLKSDKRHLYRFPSDERRCRQWIQATGRPELENKSIELLQKNNYICDIHFQASDRTSKKLKIYAIPTLNLPLRKNINPSKETQTDKPEPEIDKVVRVPSTLEASQISRGLTYNAPQKRNLQNILNEECKRCKFTENEKICIISEESLSPRLQKLINLQRNLKQKSKGNRYVKEYKLFILKIYLASPLAYRVLAETLSLPNKRALRRLNIDIGTNINPKLLDCLNSKLKNMKDTEKYCIICIDVMSLKRNLYYEINKDKIIGFHEINGEQKAEPASQAFVIMARGIFSNWKQQIGYSLLAQSKNYENLNEWLDDVILKLINIGFNVVAFVSDQGSIFLNMANERGVSVEKPYFFINGKKIFYIFDVPHLVKSLRNNLLKYDFEYPESDETKLTAKWEDVKKFYSLDSQRSYRLAPILTESHIKPSNFEKINVKTAVQVFSKTVAAGMINSIECGHLDKSAIGTIKLLDLINKTVDVLNSSTLINKNKYKNAFSSQPHQNELLDKFESFLSTVTVRNKDKKDVTNSIKCFEGFKISVKSIRCLTAELAADGFSFLYTKRLTQDALEKFFETARQQGGKCRKPTPLQFTRTFRKFFMVNMLRNTDDVNCSDDFDRLMTTYNISDFNNTKHIVNEEQFQRMENTAESLAVAVNTVDYRLLDLPEKNALVYVCAYLLNKCFNIHKCEKITNLIKECKQKKQLSKYFFTSTKCFNGDKTLLLYPSNKFVDYVKEMDNHIKQHFEPNILGRVGNQLLKEMENLNFDDCCECFPNEYLKKLFVRFRVFNIIKFNNRCFRDKVFKQNYLSVCNL